MLCVAPHITRHFRRCELFSQDVSTLFYLSFPPGMGTVSTFHVTNSTARCIQAPVLRRIWRWVFRSSKLHLPSSTVSLSALSVPLVSLALETGDPSCGESSEGQQEPNATSRCLRPTPHLIPPRWLFVISKHHKKKKKRRGEYSKAQYSTIWNFDRETTFT